MKLICIPILYVTLILTGAVAKAFAPMDGISILTYSASATVQAPLSPLTLSFGDADNPVFNGALGLGELTGDSDIGTNWSLQVVFANYETISPGLENLLGIAITPTDGTARIGDLLTVTFDLNFSKEQSFRSVSPPTGSPPGTTLSSATLTPSAAGSVDLLTTSANTVFGPGNYTLTLSGTVNDDTQPELSLVAEFNAIPEPTVLVLSLMSLVLIARHFRKN